MPTASERIIQAIEYVVKPVSVGTNWALLQLIWAMVNGSFLVSRGAIHDALSVSDYTKVETRRCWRALRYGKWNTNVLIKRWRQWVAQESHWKRLEYEGWYAISCDVVVFPRLKLQSWIAKMYRGTFGRAVKAVGFGVIVDIGEAEGMRVPLLLKIIRCQNTEDSAARLKAELLKASAGLLGKRGVLVHDAGASVRDLQQAGATRFVLRLAKNCVARWDYLPDNAHAQRQYGKVVRPLARTSKGKETLATNDATEQGQFEHNGRLIAYKRWQNVVTKKDKVADNAERYDIWLFLIRCMLSRYYWQAILKQHQQQFFGFT